MAPSSSINEGKPLGAMPSGFRMSTLTPIQRNSDFGTLTKILWPYFDKTGYRFKDMRMNLTSRQMNPVITRFNISIAIQQGTNIPLVGAGVSIHGRYLNIAIFGKNKVIGNVVSLPADVDLKNIRTWKFKGKGGTSSNENSVCVRTDEFGPDVSIIFELVIVVSWKIEDGLIGLRQKLKSV